ncbi:MAG: 8-amino-7-oxononanoate synthase [Paramuribaculum sp.]|nr:8-amino-7-oxononanoate synthase [Bacteroides sp.]MDE7460362.1 8-amino-7-oxononanoate synthase [Paramuribaculum sp.]
MNRIAESLERLRSRGNYRSIPPADRREYLDFTSNDYLGLAGMKTLQEEFFARTGTTAIPLSSSASRLLSGVQEEFEALEEKLERLYGRSALLFNSGYHANTGMIAALGDSHTLILADKLVHASIIDGYRLSDARMVRFRHNDIAHLEKLLARMAGDYERVIVVVESVYSMDGDSPDLQAITELKQRYGNVMVYVDEAHAFGVCGPKGLGLCATPEIARNVDIVVGTLGKAGASSGAFVITGKRIKEYAVNSARSLIFSTAIPPICCSWTNFLLDKIIVMDDERQHLKNLGVRLAESLQPLTDVEITPSHIQPFILGDSRRAVELSGALLEEGIKVLPIRTPTVPAGTERLRISLSAGMDVSDVDRLAAAIGRLI